jgi:hypothetical protein
MEDLAMTEVFEPDPGEVMDASESGVREALRSGAAEGAQAAEDVWSTGGRGVSATAYGGAYYLAYGVTFAAMFVGHFIPHDSAFSKGLREGADDAVTAFEDWEAPQAAKEDTVPQEPLPEAEVVPS